MTARRLNVSVCLDAVKVQVFCLHVVSGWNIAGCGGVRLLSQLSFSQTLFIGTQLPIICTYMFMSVHIYVYVYTHTSTVSTM